MVSHEWYIEITLSLDDWQFFVEKMMMMTRKRRRKRRWIKICGYPQVFFSDFDIRKMDCRAFPLSLSKASHDIALVTLHIYL